MTRLQLLIAGAGLATAACTTDQVETAGTSTPSKTPAPTASTAAAATPTDRWRAGKVAPAGVLSAYANDSVLAGEPLQLHVSAASKWRASVYRIGHFAGKGGTKVAEVAGPKRLRKARPWPI